MMIKFDSFNEVETYKKYATVEGLLFLYGKLIRMVILTLMASGIAFVEFVAWICDSAVDVLAECFPRKEKKGEAHKVYHVEVVD